MRTLTRFQKLGIFFLITSILALISFWILLKSIEAKKWRALEASVLQWTKELEGRRGPRPVLRGAPQPGNAWEDYLQAVTVMDLKESLDLLEAFVDRKPGVNPDKIKKLLSIHASALDHLKLGLKRGKVEYPDLQTVNYDDPALLPVVHARELASLAVSRAILLADEGRVREAAEILLDVCQFSQDIARVGSSHSEGEGLDILGIALRQIRDLIVNATLDVQTLEQVDRELDQIERNIPLRSLVFVRGLVMTGTDLLSGKVLDPAMKKQREAAVNSRFPLWRYGFSRTLYEAEAFSRYETWVRTAIALEKDPWNTEKAFYVRLRHEEDRGDVELWSVPRNAFPGKHRRMLAHLRLLRVAARFRATGAIHILEDPFGSKLKAKETAGVLRIWSLGREGIDHGGVGYWEPTDDRDILLELKR